MKGGTIQGRHLLPLSKVLWFTHAEPYMAAFQYVHNKVYGAHPDEWEADALD